MTLRVLFITGNLEQGRCGVADYTLSLAKELSSVGVTCACISINDIFCLPEIPCKPIRYKLYGINLTRLSFRLSWHKRLLMFLDEIDNFRPDWVSLQYVPYSFSARGLPFSLLRFLCNLDSSARWHIMAHELWIDPKVSVKDRLVSSIQRFVLLSIIHRIRPCILNTSNFCYKKTLSDSGVKSTILPLFSNIPYLSVDSSSNEYNPGWTFIFFGSIPLEWHPEPLLSQIEIARIHCSIKFCKFISVGKIGDHGNRVWNSLQELSYKNFSFFQLGELSPEGISKQLQLADFGVSVAPSHLIEKSGSVAAMLAHGLPVIINRLSPYYDQFNQSLSSSQKFILLDQAFVDKISTSRKYPPINMLAETAKQFLVSLQSET